MKIYKMLILLFLCKINVSFGIIKTVDSTVALVNHHVILDSDVRKNLYIIKYNTPNFYQHLLTTSSSYQEMLHQQITKNLIFNKAKQENIHVKKHQIDEIINNILYIHNITLDQFHKHLAHFNLNYKEYCSQLYQDISNNIICERIVRQRAHILPTEIQELMQILNTINYNKEFKIIHMIFPLPIQATQDQIKITEKLAKNLITNHKIHDKSIKIINNDDSKNYIFQIIKMRKTEWISWKNMPIIFDQYLQSINVNDIIGPIYSYDGIHILQIKDMRYKKFTLPITKVKIKIITVKKNFSKKNAIENLLKIKKYVENGDNTFNLIIQENPQDYYITDHKKYLRWNDLDDLDPEIKKSLKCLQKNEISAPIHTSFGWCLVQLIDINNLNYSDMIRERAYYYLLRQKFNIIINKWIQELQSTSYIKIIDKHD